MTFAIGVVASIVSLVILVPQIRRLLRTGRAEGVSPTWAVLGIVLNAGWFAFVVAEEVWMAILPDLVVIGSFALTAWAMRRNGARFERAIVVGVLATVAIVVIQVVAGWETLGTALALAQGLHYLPAVWTAWRTRSPVGLSAGTWYLALAEALTWGTYGHLIDNQPFVLFALVELVAAVLILMRLAMVRDRVRHTLAAR